MVGWSKCLVNLTGVFYMARTTQTAKRSQNKKPKTERKQEGEESEITSLLTQFRLGSEGGASGHECSEPEELQEEIERDDFFVPPYVPSKFVAPGAKHGDVVDTMGYRGCGCHVLEKLHPFNNTDFLAHKTWEEYGYTVPPAFSDVPDVSFYAAHGCSSVLVFPPIVLEGKSCTLKSEVLQAIEERKRDPVFLNENFGETIVVDVTKLHEYFIHFEEDGMSWVTLDDGLSLFLDHSREEEREDPLHRKEFEAAMERIRRRRNWLRKFQSSLLAVTFRGIIPKDICQKISEYL